MHDQDPYDLMRFVDAQAETYLTALAEIRAGRKQTHWMWFIFPQFEGLGCSAVSRTYAIGSTAEAEAYLGHPLLGARLVESCQAAVGVKGSSARQIFGDPDDLKLRSCATLFACVSTPASTFQLVLDTYFDGVPDPRTLHLIAAARESRKGRATP